MYICIYINTYTLSLYLPTYITYLPTYNSS